MSIVMHKTEEEWVDHDAFILDPPMPSPPKPTNQAQLHHHRSSAQLPHQRPRRKLEKPVRAVAQAKGFSDRCAQGIVTYTHPIFQKHYFQRQENNDERKAMAKLYECITGQPPYPTVGQQIVGAGMVGSRPGTGNAASRRVRRDLEATQGRHQGNGMASSPRQRSRRIAAKRVGTGSSRGARTPQKDTMSSGSDLSNLVSSSTDESGDATPNRHTTASNTTTTSPASHMLPSGSTTTVTGKRQRSGTLDSVSPSKGDATPMDDDETEVPLLKRHKSTNEASAVTPMGGRETADYFTLPPRRRPRAADPHANPYAAMGYGQRVGRTTPPPDDHVAGDDAATVVVSFQLKKGRHGAPLDIRPFEGLDTLNPDEHYVCKHLRLKPLAYQNAKETLVNEAVARAGHFKKTQAQKILRIDVNKTGKLYDYFMYMGWLPVPTNE